MRKYFFIGIIFIAVATAQPNRPQRDAGVGGLIMTFQPKYILKEDGNHSLFIFYRIRYDKFIFTKTIENNKSVFKGSGELQIEVLDSIGVSFSRKFIPIDISIEDNSTSKLRKLFVQGFAEFTIPSGKYTAIYKFSDNEIKDSPIPVEKENLQATIPKDEIVIPNFASTAISSSIFLTNATTADSTIELFNLGNDVYFSQNFGLAFAAKNKLSNKSVKISLNYFVSPDEKTELFKDSTIDVTEKANTTLTFYSRDNGIYANFTESKNSQCYFFTLNGKKLKQGRYELVIKNSTDNISLTFPFTSRWLDMPISLTNLDLAIEVLRYIASKDEFDKINSGRRTKKIEAFNSFWEKKDPTPETAFNEAMAEYYRRVDYSVTQFGTLEKPNGAFTDRGKVYILNGKPNTIDRILAPNGLPKEIWKYTSMNKTFIFEDASKKGNYKLIDQQ